METYRAEKLQAVREEFWLFINEFLFPFCFWRMFSKFLWSLPIWSVHTPPLKFLTKVVEWNVLLSLAHLCSWTAGWSAPRCLGLAPSHLCSVVAPLIAVRLRLLTLWHLCRQPYMSLLHLKKTEYTQSAHITDACFHLKVLNSWFKSEKWTLLTDRIQHVFAFLHP